MRGTFPGSWTDPSGLGSVRAVVKRRPKAILATAYRHATGEFLQHHKSCGVSRAAAGAAEVSGGVGEIATASLPGARPRFRRGARADTASCPEQGRLALTSREKA